MINIITTKPPRTVSVDSYGVSSYIDKKTNKTVYKVYGTVSGSTSRWNSVTKPDGEDMKLLETNPHEIIIYRTEDMADAIECKNFIDYGVSVGARCFSVDKYLHRNDEPPNAEVAKNGD